MSDLKKSLDHPGSYGILTSPTPAESNPGDWNPGGRLDNPVTQTGQPGPALLVLVLVLTNTPVLGDVLLLAALAAAASKVGFKTSRGAGKAESTSGASGQHTGLFRDQLQDPVSGCSESKSLRGLASLQR